MQAAVTRFREMNQNTAILVVLLELKFMFFRSLSKDLWFSDGVQPNRGCKSLSPTLQVQLLQGIGGSFELIDAKTCPFVHCR